ncbi:MAG: hypothetical protein ACOH1V_04955 [Stenotrophomonas sp.]
MSTTLQRLWQRARRRRAAITLLTGLPLALAASAWALRLGGFDVATVMLVAGLLLVSGLATWRARRFDHTWLQRQLDSRRDMEDSAELLFADAATLNPLQRRQRERVHARLHAAPPDLRPRWPWRRLLAVWLLGIALIAGVRLWPPALEPAARTHNGSPATSATANPPRLQRAQLSITAPAYTGIAATQQDQLDATAPQGSRLRWSLRFAPQPQQVQLRFHDGRTIALHAQDGQWTGEHLLDRSALYRIVTTPALAEAPLQRLEAIPDRAPQIRVLQPERTLTLAGSGQRQWALLFEASDDYGVAASGQLKITVAQGSGENIVFREQSVTLAGSGPARQRRFARTLDLAALGVQPGDDLIAQLSVDDNRAPVPQTARSASLILRLPSEQALQTSDLEGAIKKVMPAYFRSQRQIIIDAEALLKQRRTLAADTFISRADAIGVDQRILRLRYGQFLGEESEGGAKPPPTSDVPGNDAPTTGSEPAHTDDDGHDHGTASSDAAAPVFGSASDVLSEYGHTHDHAEAATLLDPQTRATLKAALDQMWRSEGELRQGRPDTALPFAYKALGLIKQVQQAERIYLARVGPELPPIDEGRRMGGDRTGIAPGRSAPVAIPTRDDAAVQVWQQLGEPDAAVDLDALTRWLGENERALPDPLALAAAIEELRATPDCAACRQRLRARLWTALRRPLPQVLRRPGADAAGQRYLRALEAESP